MRKVDEIRKNILEKKLTFDDIPHIDKVALWESAREPSHICSVDHSYESSVYRIRSLIISLLIRA